jgi:hypothetical protein
MNILEMEGICSILWNILHDALDVVESVASICKIFAKLTTINHLEVRFNCGVRMYPDINEGVEFLDWICPEGWG